MVSPTEGASVGFPVGAGVTGVSVGFSVGAGDTGASVGFSVGAGVTRRSGRLDGQFDDQANGIRINLFAIALAGYAGKECLNRLHGVRRRTSR